MFGDDDRKDADAPQAWTSEHGAAEAAAGADGGSGRGLHLNTDEHGPIGPNDLLDLSENDRLPWLESGEDEDDEDYVGVDSRRVFGAVAAMLAVLAVIVGGIWWFTHRGDSGKMVADGSTIAAAAGPYKEAPKDPGGKTYAGTGDSSFAVSQGESRPAQLAEGAGAIPGTAPVAAPAAASANPAQRGAAAPAVSAAVAPRIATPAAAEPAYSGGVVQVGAYTSQTTAEAGWNRLLKQSATLSGVQHRVVEGKADIGTVYRLQVLTGAGGGGALCAKLRGEGLACQVKH